MRSLLLIACLFLIAQAATVPVNSTSDLTDLELEWETAERVVKTQEVNVEAAKLRVEKKEAEFEKASRTYDEKMAKWDELSKKAEVLERPYRLAREELARLRESESAAKKMREQAQSALEESQRTLNATQADRANLKVLEAELASLPQKAALEEQVANLRSNVATQKSAHDQLATKSERRHKQWKDDGCNSRPSGPSCPESSRLAMDALDKDVEAARKALEAANQALVEPAALLDRFDVNVDGLQKRIADARNEQLLSDQQNAVKANEEKLEEAKTKETAARTAICAQSNDACKGLQPTQKLPPEVKKAVEAAEKAEWARDDANAVKKLIEKDLAGLRQAITTAEGELEDAKAKQQKLAQMKGLTDEGPSTGVKAAIGVLLFVIITAVIVGAIVYFKRGAVFKKVKKLPELEMNGISSKEDDASFPFLDTIAEPSAAGSLESEKPAAITSVVSSDEEQLLILKEDEQLKGGIEIYQIENGTRVYLNNGSPQKRKLSFMTPNGEKEIKILDGKLSNVCAHGNVLYFILEREVYGAVFSASDGVNVYLVREQKEDEKIHEGICTRQRNGKQFAYRIWEDPDYDGHVFDVGGKSLITYFYNHRGQIVYFTSCKSLSHPTLTTLDEYFCEIETPTISLIYGRDSARFFYVVVRGILFSFDTETMKPLHSSKLSNHPARILGVHNGIMTMESDKYLTTTQLPEDHFDIASPPDEDEPIIIGKKMTDWKEVRRTSSTSESPSKLLSDYSSKFLNEFTVKSVIGEGGFGCVLEAVNLLDKSDYAVKRIAMKAKELERGLAEVQALAHLAHPSIVRYNTSWIERPPEGWQHDADAEMLRNIGSSKRRLMNFRDDNIFIYIQMELCLYSLNDWLRINPHQSSRDLVRMRNWFRQMVCAVEFIHSKRYIHRDLKPKNVLFVEKDCLKLCDLGVVAERGDDNVENTIITRTSIGTQLYMSPEQRFMIPFGSKSDVFTLGLMLVELCVAMTAAVRLEVFENYRNGKEQDPVADESTARLIRRLTNVRHECRPSSKELLTLITNEPPSLAHLVINH